MDPTEQAQIDFDTFLNSESISGLKWVETSRYGLVLHKNIKDIIT
jgi:hypothetical protein